MKNQTGILAILCCLLAVFAASSAYLAAFSLESASQRSTYRQLAALAEAARQEQTGEEEPGMLPEYRELYGQNPDLVGWFRIPGTAIDYPVVQSPDRPGYYLTHDFYGEESDYGCIYLGEACDLGARPDNLILYGHHMADGSMFAGLLDYRRRDWWESHDLIRFDTLTDRRCYRIFAVFAADPEEFPYHRFIDAEDAAGFNAFVAGCLELSYYDTGIVPAWGDELLCLSTCEYSRANGRLVVAAVRVRE